MVAVPVGCEGEVMFGAIYPVGCVEDRNTYAVDPGTACELSSLGKWR